jgi:hypothetical protein
MKKEKFNIEYQLKTASVNVLWNSISTSLGLAEWFADNVKEKDNKFTFTWEKHEQLAFLQSKKVNSYVKFQWEEDLNSDYYFELKIVSLEISGDLALVVTDFADTSDKDDLVLLWNKQIQELRRKTGI